jgi:tryptophan 7-halogenase
MSKIKKIQNIVILGGGSSGWSAAAYLAIQLHLPQNPLMKITLVESSDIPTVGVGEATVTHFKSLLLSLKFKEQEWIQHCNATFKIGINFVG